MTKTMTFSTTNRPDSWDVEGDVITFSTPGDAKKAETLYRQMSDEINRLRALAPRSTDCPDCGGTGSTPIGTCLRCGGEGVLAPRPEAQAQQCPWAFYGTHMCRESFEAREQGLGTKKLRYPHGDPRNKPEDDPYEMSLRMNSGPERKP